jgi:hypothetical protein
MMDRVGRSAIWCSLAAAIVLGPAIARADDIATDEDVCRGKADGTPCTHDLGSGTCQATTCPSIDYSTRPPGSKDRPCSKCLPAKPAPTPTRPPESKVPPVTEVGATPTAGCAIDRTAATLGSLLLGLGLVALARRGAPR